MSEQLNRCQTVVRRTNTQDGNKIDTDARCTVEFDETNPSDRISQLMS